MISSLKGYRFPVSIISHAIWLYHRFSLSFRDIEEMLRYRGIYVSYETIRNWCYKFGSYYDKVLRKRKYKRGDKWHLDEMVVKINGETYILCRAVDSEGYELDVLLQKRKDKKSAIRFLSKLLDTESSPRVVVTDKLRSYNQPIKRLFPKAKHLSHKGLNNRAENGHLPTRRREKSLIKFKSPRGLQQSLSLMGQVRNLFAINVGRYTKKARERRLEFQKAAAFWDNATQGIIAT